MNDAPPDTVACPAPGASPMGPTAIANSVGTVLADAARAAGREQDAGEIKALVEAMVRLLAGVPLRSDGKLTVKSLAQEAGLRRNKLTHKHIVLKDLFYALVAAQDSRPTIADDLHAANAELHRRLERVTAERDGIKNDRDLLARLVHVLEVENEKLRTELEAHAGVADLETRRRLRNALEDVIGPR